jgi:pilus assembly protein Flp/PilA
MSLQYLIAWLRCAFPAWQSASRRLSAGQGLVEYSLILILVAVVMIVVAVSLGPAIGNMYSNIVAVMNGSQQ